MKAVNLRSDLAQLSDDELAARLQNAWQAYDQADKGWGWSRPVMSGRGPVRHPRAYRFLAALSGATNGHWIDLLLAAAFSGKATERFLRSADPGVDLHLTLCEIHDLTDELERRVAKRHRRP